MLLDNNLDNYCLSIDHNHQHENFHDDDDNDSNE